MSSHQGYYATSPLPINMTSKSPYYTMHHQYRHASVSPPEAPASSATSGLLSHLSYTNSPSSYSSSSSGELDPSSPAAGGVDFFTLITDRLTNSFDPIPSDRSLAIQAQTSGALNAKHRELLELQAVAQRRLAAASANLAEGVKAAKEVKRDLEWTQKRVSALSAGAERKYPVEYNMARDRHPTSDY